MDTIYNNIFEVYLGGSADGILDDLDFLEGGDYYDSGMYSTF